MLLKQQQQQSVVQSPCNGTGFCSSGHIGTAADSLRETQLGSTHSASTSTLWHSLTRTLLLLLLLLFLYIITASSLSLLPFPHSPFNGIHYYFYITTTQFFFFCLVSVRILGSPYIGFVVFCSTKGKYIEKDTAATTTTTLLESSSSERRIRK